MGWSELWERLDRVGTALDQEDREQAEGGNEQNTDIHHGSIVNRVCRGGLCDLFSLSVCVGGLQGRFKNARNFPTCSPGQGCTTVQGVGHH